MPKVILIFFISLIIWSCSPGGVAGTGTNAGNGNVAAVVVYPDGSAATGVDIFLREATYLRDTATVHIKREADTTADSRGAFRFDSLPDGTYHLEIHNRCRFAKVVPLVVENGNVLELEDTIKLEGVSTLGGAIAADDVPEGVSVYVQIQGLEYVQQVSEEGQYYFSGLPAGEHALTFISGSKETGSISGYAVKTEASKSTMADEVSFPISLVKDTLYVRDILNKNGLESVPVWDVVTIAKGRVLTLMLDSLGLTQLPKGLGRMRARHISMEGNLLTEIPYGIPRNPALQSFNMSGNKLKTVPGFLAGIPHLRSLKLTHNDIDSISDGLTKLATLEVLDLSGNRIHTLPTEIGSLQALDTLRLQDNELETLPKGIIAIKGLSELHVNNNRLGTVVEPVKEWIDAYSKDPDWKETQKQ